MLPVCPLPIIAIGAGNAFAAFRWCLYELFFADRQAPLQHIDEHVHELSIDSPGQGLLWDVACGEGIVAMRAPLSTKRWVFGQFDSAIAWNLSSIRVKAEAARCTVTEEKDILLSKLMLGGSIAFFAQVMCVRAETCQWYTDYFGWFLIYSYSSIYPKTLFRILPHRIEIRKE